LQRAFLTGAFMLSPYLYTAVRCRNSSLKQYNKLTGILRPDTHSVEEPNPNGTANYAPN
jgi:hypothetical protein